MRKRQEFRPLAIDALEDRVVMSHAAVAPALVNPFLGSLDAQNSAYIEALYAFTGRTPNPGGVEFHEDLLTSGRQSRFQVAQAFLNTSQGANTFTTSLYQLLLDRTPSATELGFYTQGRHPRAASLVNETAQILGSPEYFNLAGGTNAGYVSRVYNDIFGRAPDASARFYVNELNSGASRQFVASQILNSPEGASNLVFFATTRVFNRAPHASEQVYTNYLLGGGSIQNVFASLLASQEFFNNAQVRFG